MKTIGKLLLILTSLIILAGCSSTMKNMKDSRSPAMDKESIKDLRTADFGIPSLNF